MWPELKCWRRSKPSWSPEQDRPEQNWVVSVSTKKFLRFLAKLKSHSTTSSPLRETCSVVFVFCPLWKRVTLVRVFAKWAKSVSFECSLEVGISTGVWICKVLLLFEKQISRQKCEDLSWQRLNKHWSVFALRAQTEKNISLSLSLSLWSVYLRERARVLCRELWERESGAVVGFTEAQRWVDFTPFPQQFPQIGSTSPSLTHPPLSHTVGNFCQRAANTGCSQKMRERERVCGYIEERERERERDRVSWRHHCRVECSSKETDTDSKKCLKKMGDKQFGRLIKDLKEKPSHDSFAILAKVLAPFSS